MASNSLLTPRDSKLLVRYLDGVDAVVSARLGVGFSPHEDHLTALLCELLDSRLAGLHNLEYSFAALREDLAADSAQLMVDFTIETCKYPPHIESRLTSADLGVIVEYRDYLGTGDSFTRGALFQAKRLYPRVLGEQFRLGDSFREFDRAQLERLSQLEASGPEHDGPLSHRGDGWCYYLFYSPRPETFEDMSRERIRRLVLPNDNIFDHAMGWHLYEYASSPTRFIPGLVVSNLWWLRELESAERSTSSRRLSKPNHVPTAADVFERLWGETHPFSWFLVYQMFRRQAGTSSEPALRRIRGQADGDDAELPLLPRYILTVRVQLGHG